MAFFVFLTLAAICILRPAPAVAEGRVWAALPDQGGAASASAGLRIVVIVRPSIELRLAPDAVGIDVGSAGHDMAAAYGFLHACVDHDARPVPCAADASGHRPVSITAARP